MGYYTHFKLEWTPATPPWKSRGCAHASPEGAKFCMMCGAAVEGPELAAVVAAYIQGHESFDYALDEHGQTNQGSKWYEWQDDLIKMSEEISGVVFHLSGEGEDNEDIWDAFALDGKIQVHKAVITRTTVPAPWE